MKNLLAVGVAVLGLMAASSPAMASGLPPGASLVVPDSSPELGTALGSAITHTFSGTLSGSIVEQVFTESGGKLDFDYQISITGGQLGRLTVTNYAGVDLSSSGLGVSQTTTVVSPFSPPTSGAGATNADRSVDGDTVGFNWAPKLTSPATTDILIIRTSLTSDGPNIMNIIDGTVFQFSGLGPSPEPATLALLAGMVPGLGGLVYWRRRVKN